jgi:hypothetical protein
MVPTLSLDYTSSDTTGAKQRSSPVSSSKAEVGAAMQMMTVKQLMIALGLPSAVVTLPVVETVWNKLLKVSPDLLELYVTLASATGLYPLEMLVKNLPTYLKYLPQDMGLFPGHQARGFFAEALAAKFPSVGGKPNFNACFQTHFDFFEVRLAVTGTNLETGKSEIFSVDTTPNFPVADAIRISMGLPLVYKPLVIREKELGDMLPKWVAGAWVDGGYLNNLPMPAFDHAKAANDGPDTLGLRLEEDQRLAIETFGDMLKVWPVGLGFMGVGESAISESWGFTSQSIALDTTGLSLLNFKPDPKTRNKAVSLAHQKTLEYFGAEHLEMEPQQVQVPR